VERLSHELGKPITGISEGGLKKMMEYQWPGNVRELENAVERAMVTCREHVLTENDFQFLNGARKDSLDWEIPPSMTLEDMEKQAIITTLRRCNGNIKETAQKLGMDRSTLYDRIKKFNIPR
jgi:DNA-binding NtrC family response regulator